MKYDNVDIVEKAKKLFEKLDGIETDDLVDIVNNIRKELHKYSFFRNEPVDCIQWIKNDKVEANDYNPNVVAPPEMRLLAISIKEDGYTQPIVSWKTNDHYEVVDGFHRHRVGKEDKDVNGRVKGYLPCVVMNEDRTDRCDRISSTIRHNRARGKHSIEGMSDIVIELKRRNWSNKRISKQLGMDEDEILRLCQITGLSDLFKDEEFSNSWDIEDSEDNLVEFTDDVDTYGDEIDEFRTVNTSDEDRIFHTFDKWECYKAGFYNTTMDGLTNEECGKKYYDLLSDTKRFSEILEHIITEWEYSCQHYLTNQAMNRIAWLGQAAVCYSDGVPSTFRGGYNLLSKKQQKEANETALIYLNKWLETNDKKKITLQEALTERQSILY